jgi:hypothetical protein
MLAFIALAFTQLSHLQLEYPLKIVNAKWCAPLPYQQHNMYLASTESFNITINNIEIIKMNKITLNRTTLFTLSFIFGSNSIEITTQIPTHTCIVSHHPT